MSSQAFGALGIYFLTLSVTASLPRSCRIKIAMAVNCLVIEPRRNLVLAVQGTSCSRLAMPYPRQKRTWPFLASRTVPLKWSRSTRAAMYCSILEVSSSGEGRSARATVREPRTSSDVAQE